MFYSMSVLQGLITILICILDENECTPIQRTRVGAVSFRQAVRRLLGLLDDGAAL